MEMVYMFGVTVIFGADNIRQKYRKFDYCAHKLRIYFEFKRKNETKIIGIYMERRKTGAWNMIVTPSNEVKEIPTY